MRKISLFKYRKTLLLIIICLLFQCVTNNYFKMLDKDLIDINKLKSVMNYPELRISNFNIHNFRNLEQSFKFNILQFNKDTGLISISVKNFKDNLKYIKDLCTYYNTLRKVVLAYSQVQGALFTEEISEYLKIQNIINNCPSKLRFISYQNYSKDKFSLKIKKLHLDRIEKNKEFLKKSNDKMEFIISNFIK